MFITPHVNLLKSLRGERINYTLLIGEGIDNALDADAREVSVQIGDDQIRFRDDGIGITQDRIASLFSLGDHGAMSTTQLGRFGIGIKHQAINAGNIFRVNSTSHDGRIVMRVDWGKILRAGTWEVEDPRWIPVVVGSATGTTITIGDLRRPPKLSMEKIHDELALLFRPALVDDKRIMFNNRPVEILPDPPMTDIIDRQLSLSGGRTARLYAGMLAGPSRLKRVHVGFKHRVIMPDSILGCGDYSGLSKMYARLQIAGPWHLAKFKDDVTDEVERDELEEAIEDALRPLLERCSSESMTLRIAQLTQAVNNLVAPELQSARPHGGKGGKGNGKAGEKRQAGKVSPDKSDPDGPARSPRPPRDQLKITFDGEAAVDGIGSMKSSGRRKQVSLSPDHPYVAELIRLRDDGLVARTILVVAMAIFEHHRGAVQEDMIDPFGKRIAKMLAINEVRGVA